MEERKKNNEEYKETQETVRAEVSKEEMKNIDAKKKQKIMEQRNHPSLSEVSRREKYISSNKPREHDFHFLQAEF